jgi:hypothetical protein
MCKDYDETEEKALALVKKDGMAFKDIPEKHKTSAVCLEAVRKNCGALEYVPENFKTAELCLEAVRQNNSAFKLEAVRHHVDFPRFFGQRVKPRCQVLMPLV